jgi:hypothetical protein
MRHANRLDFVSVILRSSMELDIVRMPVEILVHDTRTAHRNANTFQGATAGKFATGSSAIFEVFGTPTIRVPFGSFNAVLKRNG